MNHDSPLIQLLDDDQAVRDGLSLLLATVGLRVQTWAEPLVFLQQFDAEAIGAIVLDARMPGLGGLSVLAELQARGADQPVILLTGHGSVELCRRAFKQGAFEFLEKPVDDEVLIDTVQQALRLHLHQRSRHEADREARARLALLTPREREVLQQVVAGLSNKQIARALDLSPRTVETHRLHLSAKLEVDSLAQLVRRYASLLDSLGA